MDAADIQQLIDEAEAAIERGDVAEAVALADRLVAICPDDAQVRAVRVNALLKADEVEAAFCEARRTVELAPESEQIQFLLGLAAWRSNRMTLAQQSLERAIELSNSKPRLLADYAWFMAYERGPRLGEEAALRAIAAAENSSTAWAALGMAQFRLRRHEEAAESLKRALKLDPNDCYAQLAMARLLQERRQDNQAMALASLLEDTPGTEPLVEEIRQQAKRRQVAMKLVERKALPEKHDGVPRHANRWLVLAAMLSAAVVILIGPTTPLSWFLSMIVPVVVMWPLRKIFG